MISNNNSPKTTKYILIFALSLFWSTVGFILFRKGLNYLSDLKNHSTFILPIVFTASVIIGYFKEKFMLSKSSKKIQTKILNYNNSGKITDIFEKKFFFIIGFMMLLGKLLAFIPIPLLLKIIIVFSVSTALFLTAINFIKFYFSLNYKLKKSPL